MSTETFKICDRCEAEVKAGEAHYEGWRELQRKSYSPRVSNVLRSDLCGQCVGEFQQFMSDKKENHG